MDEWSTRNSAVRYPLAQQDAAGLALPVQIPDGFLSDLRFFAPGQRAIGVYISRVQFDGSSAYTIDFKRASDGATLLSGSAAWTGSDFGKKLHIGSGPAVAVFSPGRVWDDGDFGLGGGASPFDYSVGAGAGQVEPGNVFHGPNGVSKLILAAPYYNSDGELQEEDEEFDPDDPANALGVTERIVAGYNVSLSGGGGSIEIGVSPGAGAGLYPCAEDIAGSIRTINGEGPAANGNISLAHDGCFRISRTNDSSSGVPSKNVLWLFNDCPPCCGCYDYTRVARAISRMSAKFRDINDVLVNTIEETQEQYEAALAKIKKNSPTMSMVTNIQVYPAHVSVDVVNASSAPAYIVMSTLLGHDLELVPSGAVRAGIDPEGGLLSPTENPTEIVESSGVEGFEELSAIYTVGYGSAFEPIPPGAHTRVWFRSPSASDTLACLSDECSAYRSYLQGAYPETEEIAAIDSAIDALRDLVTEECKDGTDLSCDQEAVCWHQNMARYIQGQDLAVDKFIEFVDWTIRDESKCYDPISTAEIDALLDEYAATNEIVDDACKDAAGPDAGVGLCDADVTMKMDTDLSTCRAKIRKQRAERERILLGDRASSGAGGLLEMIRAAIDERFEEMAVEAEEALVGSNVSQLSFSSFAIYGHPSASYSCSAGNAVYEVGESEVPADIDDAGCVAAITYLYDYAAAKSDALPVTPSSS